MHYYGQHRPDVIRIMSCDIRIDWFCDLHGEFGTWDLAEQRIEIDKSVSPLLAVDVLLHEIMHACWEFSSLAKKEKEERVVSTLSSGLAAVLNSNPTIAMWIAEISTLD